MNIRWELKKIWARRNNYRRNLTPPHPRLHIGCGSRNIEGFVNSDVSGSEFDLDLGFGRLPWRDNCFETVLMQHVIEHLELISEVIPLLDEVYRVLLPGGQVWITCPDIEKICNSYVRNGPGELVRDIRSRHPEFSLAGGQPESGVMNHLFHQNGEHRNLFDFCLLQWALSGAGFEQVDRFDETELCAKHPAIAPRNDSLLTLAVVATK